MFILGLIAGLLVGLCGGVLLLYKWRVRMVVGLASVLIVCAVAVASPLSLQVSIALALGLALGFLVASSPLVGEGVHEGAARNQPSSSSPELGTRAETVIDHE